MNTKKAFTVQDKLYSPQIVKLVLKYEVKLLAVCFQN